MDNIDKIEQQVIVIGHGEIGGVFSRAILRAGHPVIPVTRDISMWATCEHHPHPRLVLIAVGEKDLQPLLADIPDNWRTNLLLVQNELLPNDWLKHDLNPTVISVWFEKKKGQDFKVILPSPIYGPDSKFISAALSTLGIPCNLLKSSENLSHELIVKNLYILTSNIAGLRVGGTVGQLWSEHETLTRAVATEIIEIQSSLIGTALDEEALIKGMSQAFEADPEHKCMGRSAPARLENALRHGEAANFALPVLSDIRRKWSESART